MGEEVKLNQGAPTGDPVQAVSQTIEPAVQPPVPEGNGETKPNPLLGDLQKWKNKFRKLEEKNELDEKGRLEKKGEFESLYKKEQDNNKGLLNMLKLKELKLLAQQQGFINPDDVKQFSDQFKFNEDLEVTNSQEVFDKLKTDRGYFFGKPNAQVPNTTGDTPPAYTPSGDVITLAEMNRRKKLPGYVAWYDKNKEEIQNLATAGRLK